MCIHYIKFRAGLIIEIAQITQITAHGRQTSYAIEEIYFLKEVQSTLY